MTLYSKVKRLPALFVAANIVCKLLLAFSLHFTSVTGWFFSPFKLEFFKLSGSIVNFLGRSQSLQEKMTMLSSLLIVPHFPMYLMFWAPDPASPW